MLCHTAGLSYLTHVPASVPLGRNTGQDFVMLEFSQELDSLHPPGQPASGCMAVDGQSTEVHLHCSWHVTEIAV